MTNDIRPAHTDELPPGHPPIGIKRPIAELPLPPGTSGLPWLGETIGFATGPSKFITARQKRHGDIFQTHILGAKTVVLIGHTAAQWIFSGEDKYVESRFSVAVGRLLGAQGVTQLNGDAHRERRRLFAPHFKYEAMSNFVSTIQGVVTKHLAAWDNGVPVLELVPAMRKMAFEIIAAFIFGEDAAALDLAYLSDQFQIWEKGMFTPLPVDLPFMAFGKALRAKEALRDAIRPIVVRRRESGTHAHDMLGTFLDSRNADGSALPIETIIDEIQVLLFAGHDTTVTSVSNLLVQLAQHPDVLGRARDEQKTFNDGDRFTTENLKAMPYLDAVINESLRLIPPIGGMFRVTLDDLEIGGYRIPKGWTILLNAGISHRDATVWQNPEAFEPERWLRAEKHPPFSHFPFGGGPRLCLGQSFAWTEMRIVVALLLRHYRWDLLPEQNLDTDGVPFPIRKDGGKVRFAAL